MVKFSIVSGPFSFFRANFMKIMVQKMAKKWSKMAIFGHFLAILGHFWTKKCHSWPFFAVFRWNFAKFYRRTAKNGQKWHFLVQKWPKMAQKWPFLTIFDHFLSFTKPKNLACRFKKGAQVCKKMEFFKNLKFCHQCWSYKLSFPQFLALFDKFRTTFEWPPFWLGRLCRISPP